MVNEYNPDEWVAESEKTMLPCPHCNGEVGCKHAYGSANYSLRRATPEEYKENRLKRLRKRREELERERYHILLEISLIEHDELWKRLAHL